ncbi:hypothetical protein QZH41_020722 [Actinostola sp. cb2023]|nr:hypothetical protein QZH41_020722 [Actinostola sp. cb2023]
MAVSLSGLTGLKEFDTVGEPATLAQRWKKWKEEFELYVAASGVTDPTEKRALLLHLAGTGVRDIFKTFPTSESGNAKEFDKAMKSLSTHFKPKKNVPLARQTFLAEKPKPGEIINNFITRLQTLAETCEYGEEKDNQVRDQTLLFVKDKNLKSKLYRADTLTLAKLLEIVSQYHDKESLILVPDNQVNNVNIAKAQPLRRIPFSRRRKVVEKLEQLEKLDVIEKVDGPTSWVNPLVVVEKSDGDVRICLDMRQANRAIVREKHPVPTVEETLQEVSGAKVFSKLDLNMAFHQIELHPDSRDITTFAGPNGLYRYKRLLFGVNMATEKFQQIIWQIIKDCPGAHNMHDDLRVVGVNDKEHDENLDRVMHKLEENGLTLNYQKCKIGVPSMIYMGDVLSGDGLKVSSERVKAIVEAKTTKPS